MNATRRFLISFVAYLAYFVLFFIALGMANNALEAQGQPVLADMPGWLGLVTFTVLLLWPLPVMFWFFYHTPRWKKEVQKNGRLAPAQITAVKDTGVSDGDGLSASYYVDLSLRVMSHDDAPFDGMVEVSVKRFNLPSPGDVIMVRYDPADHRHIALAKDLETAPSAEGWSPDLSAFTARMGSGRTGELADELKKLEGMYQSGSLTDQEFRLAKKKLLA